MPYSTLADLFQDASRLGSREALRFNNGFRTWTWSYDQLCERARGACQSLQELGLNKGDRLILWSENRPEWFVLFWACVLGGIQLVPLDFRFSCRLVKKIESEVQAQLLVRGDTVETGELGVRSLPIRDFAECLYTSDHSLPDLTPEDVVQIVYTSGTTGEPRGIVHRHRNVCANLEPFRREIGRYRRWATPFQPIRIYSLLPLSHLFGQALSVFISPMLGGASVVSSETTPRRVIELIHNERVSVLVVVPRMLSNLSREISARTGVKDPEKLGKGWLGTVRRWWKYRDIHRLFGLKFWSFVVGGAALDRDLEAFWRRLGFVVIQGYGLTESSPVVAVNHPFRVSPGSVGKALEGQDIRLAPDGEILVRGESVASRYRGGGSESGLVEANGWLHTGDLGEIDSEGRIYIKGRKKDVIVTSAGTNVYPDDVESVLRNVQGVRDCVVVGVHREGQEEVHAALVLDESAGDPLSIISKANSQLEEHQRIRDWTVWPQDDFPRTESTLKVKRGLVASLIESKERPSEDVAPQSELDRMFSQLTGQVLRAENQDMRLSEDLGLSSLDRIELISRLEERYGVTLDEEQVSAASTVAQLKKVVESAASGRVDVGEPETAIHFPRWARSLVVRWLRNGFQRAVTLPLLRHYIEVNVSGREEFSALKPPVILAANHASHLDTPVLLAAVPKSWRWRIAPAMLKDYFAPHFAPARFSLGERVSSTFQYFLACGLFNAFPLPHQMGGVRGALVYAGELLEEGYCPLLFPEGVRSPDGTIGEFRPGIGLMAERLQVPVLPFRIEGTFELMSPHERWPRSGAVSVKFGKAIYCGRRKPEEFALELETVVRGL